jgi:hypothetical protein
MWKHFRVTSSAILFTIETQRATTLCVLLVEVAMNKGHQCILFHYINLTLVMRSFGWSRTTHVTCHKSSCHPLGNIHTTLKSKNYRVPSRSAISKSSKFVSRPLSSNKCLKHLTEDAVLVFVF